MCRRNNFSIYRTSFQIFVPIIVAVQLVIFSEASVSGVAGFTDASNAGTFSPSRKQRPQGRETLTATRSTTVMAPRNFTTVTSSSTTRLTIGVNNPLNPLKSRLKKPGVILSLSLRSKDPKLIASSLSRTTSPNPSLTAPTRDDLMTSTISDLTQASFGETATGSQKSYKILDRLKNLTNLKMKSSASSLHYGMKKYDSAEDVRPPTTESPVVRNDSTRVGGHLTHHNVTRTRGQAMHVQVHNHGTEFTPPANVSTTTESDLETIEQVETRFVTAEQIGGNRPTKTPFHFTTTPPTQATTTTTKAPLPSRLNRYTKPYSPHNHIYAPTQNPINVAHNEEDLSVEDFRDFRAAHQAFGSKVNSAGAGNREPAHAPPPPPAKPTPITRTRLANPTPEKPTIRAPPVYRSPPPRTPSVNNPILIKTGKLPQPHPQSASSGVKNSHIKLKQNSDKANNDNLPFYKEPGGVFEHKYTDNEIEPNEIDNFNTKGPGIKYAPKGPTAQPQPTYNQQVSNNPPRPTHYQPPPPTPQYVTVTQQPIYLSPVPVQPVIHHHHPQHQHPPHPTYNPVPQHQPHPTYNPVPQHYYPPSQPHPYNPPHPSPVPYAHVPVPPTHYAPVYQAPLQAAPPPTFRPQPQQYDHRPPPHNPYPLRPRPALPAKKIDNGDNQYYDAPPARDDPASDSYYGDPRPPKPKPPKPKPPKKPPVEEEPEEEEEETEEEPKEQEEKRKEPEEDEQEYRRIKPSRPSNKGHRYSPPKRPSSNGDDGRNRERDKDYEEGDSNGDDHQIPPVEDYDHGGPSYGGNGRNRDREPQSRRPNTNNGDRPRPPFDDYDSDPNEHIDDFVRPTGERPRGYEGSDRDRNFASFPDTPRSGDAGPRPFYPSDQDRRFRPSSPDISPNFDHPNIEYPQHRTPSSDRPYSPGRSGPYSSSPSSRSRDRDLPPLDPIYTRTIKQFDEENRPRDRQPHRNNFISEHEEPEDDGSPKSPEDYAEIGEPREERRGRTRDRDREEDEEPETERGQNRGRDRNRNQPAEEEEEEEEEEQPKPNRNRNKRPQEDEEEEEEESEQDPKSRNADEEEEEEEEDDKSSNNTPSTSNQKEEKKPPPKKPQQEKSGNLDDDITGIEREFGGYFGPGNSPPSFNQQPGQPHPILSLQNQQEH